MKGRVLLFREQRDFAEHGQAAVEAVRCNEPATYLKVIASILPKQSEKTIKHDVERLTDQELIQLVRDTRDQLRGPTSPGSAGEQAKGKAQLN